jgi:hypothetical protein
LPGTERTCSLEKGDVSFTGNGIGAEHLKEAGDGARALEALWSFWLVPRSALIFSHLRGPHVGYPRCALNVGLDHTVEISGRR